jgi:uncharacterized protein (DUF1800 family)
MTGVWQTFKPTDAQPWDLRRAVHLHRCAGFAATWDQVQQDLRDGPDASVDRLLQGKSSAVMPAAKFEGLSQQLAEGAVVSDDPERLKAWWFFRMLFTPDPLGERLALMWHNHFATSNAKVMDLAAMHRQNEVFRKLGRARFGDLLHAMLHDAALLVWLDAPENRKDHGNENLGRELMELFTTGVGNFGEDDVKQSARALTGLSALDEEFRYVPEWHDPSEKTILGQTRAFDADSLCDLLTKRPPTSRRIAWRLCVSFLGEGVVSDAQISELSSGLHERELDIGWGVETVLRSQLFHSDANIGSHVIGPPEFLVGAARAMQMSDPPPGTLLLSDWSRRLGQDLFYPPNVGGWAEGSSWLTTRGVINRANFAVALVRGELNYTGTVPDLAAIARRARRGATMPDALLFFNELLLGGRLPQSRLDPIAKQAGDSLADGVALLLATPEAQLA